jgi:hypothetical protein
VSGCVGLALAPLLAWPVAVPKLTLGAPPGLPSELEGSPLDSLPSPAHAPYKVTHIGARGAAILAQLVASSSSFFSDSSSTLSPKVLL